MTALKWGQGVPQFEQGVDRGVIYFNGAGYAWSGLASVEEKPDATVQNDLYFDGVRRLVTYGPEQFAATVQAFTYPPAWEEAIIAGVTARRGLRKEFGFSYRTQTADGYKIHLVYNAAISPGGNSRKTVDEGINPEMFTWEVSTRPNLVDKAFPAAHFIIDSVESRPGALTALENMLYGSASNNAYLPTLTEILTVFDQNALLQIVDNGDGTATATGPDSMVYQVGADEWVIDSPSLEFLGDDTYYVTNW